MPSTKSVKYMPVNIHAFNICHKMQTNKCICLQYFAFKACKYMSMSIALTKWFNLAGARTDDVTRKEVVLITDGKSNCGPNVIDSALGLRNIKTPPLLLFVFAIGDFTASSRKEMEALASAPTSYHTFHFNHFNELREVVDFVLQKPIGCAPIELGL